MMTISVGMAIDELDTPVQIVDLEKLETNIAAMQRAVSAHGVRLRPHIKTHKIPEIAHMQRAVGAHGIAVAKVAEAEVFASAGFDDIAVAYPVVGPEKWRRLTRLAQTCRVVVNVDSVYAAQGLSDAATAEGVTIFVQVDIDTGFHRCGVAPVDAAALCSVIMELPGLDLDGITTHRSAFFPDHGGRPMAELGQEEGEIMGRLAADLRAQGLPIREVTCGSTPTAIAASRVPGVTEVRAGTYVFGDLIMVGVGAMDRDDISLSIISTVQSRPYATRATFDGGMKTFMGEAFPSPPKFLKGYGEAVDSSLYLEGLTEEHGLGVVPGGMDLSVGDRIAFFPNHVCTTVNLSNEIVGHRNGRVEVVWPVAARGART